ncbi:MAG TPA: hypothetical protein VGG01_06365 [Xanthobacteraceae bacterium]
MHPSSSLLSCLSGSVPLPLDLYEFAAGNDPDGDDAKPAPFDRRTAAREDLPYRVELWDEARMAVEQVLAVTANAGIGYAAYYAATREHPQRYITLRHKNHIVSRWNGPDH